MVVIVGLLSPLILGSKLGKVVPPVPALDWALAVDERTAAAAAAIHQRKIVFIGGSNIRFGLDPAAMSRDLGIPVIDYGLHASLGIDVIADRAMECVKPGDIVVFASELQHFRANGAANFSDDLRLDFLAEHPSTIDRKLQTPLIRDWGRARSRCNRIRRTVIELYYERFIHARYMQFSGAEPSSGFREKLFGSQIAHLLGAPRTPTVSSGPASTVSLATEATPYTLDAVGPDGGNIFPRPAPLPMERWHIGTDAPTMATLDLVNSRGVAAFQLVKKACDERHCILCVMPPIRLSVARFDQADLLRVDRAIINYEVSNGAIAILQPPETVLPPDYGYDTDYHLDDAGVKIMEPRIVAAMKAVIAMKTPPA